MHIKTKYNFECLCVHVCLKNTKRFLIKIKIKKEHWEI